MKNSGLGVCIGHSGSVIGIIYNNQFKSQSFLNDFIQKFSGTFKSVNNYNFIKSGIRIIIEETL